MRAALVFIALTAAAHAERIAVSADGEMTAALSVSMASRHVEIEGIAAPEGALRLDRAAAAVHVIQTAGASVAVWIDDGEVCVVSADGIYFRHAPLPSNSSPRIFAAIATSLIDELYAAVDVVTVSPTPPALASEAVVAEAPALTAGHTLLELGPTLSPASLGIEAELAVPIFPNLRIGALGGVSYLFDGIRDIVRNTALFDAAGELRYVGSGASHFEFGLVGGVMRGRLDDMSTDTGGFAALRLGYVKQYGSSTVMFSVSPMLLFDFRGEGNDQAFGLMSSVRLELPI